VPRAPVRLDSGCLAASYDARQEQVRQIELCRATDPIPAPSSEDQLRVEGGIVR
jgi:hypothetical protein